MEPRSASEAGAHIADQVEPENKQTQGSGEDEYAQPVPLAQQAQPRFLSNNSKAALSGYQSPLRQHQRTPSMHQPVKETPNARSEYKNSEDDGKSQHHINQYIIGEEIGRGSFGSVHLAADQYGNEYAVKEFSKSRLRKRARSNFLRRPHAAFRSGKSPTGSGLNSPLHHNPMPGIGGDGPEGSLHLIKEEIAIMKQLHHPNLVSLIEVLDDPEEDSLYMVLEMCKKGVIMKVGLGERADPYDTESCRYWFRDMILGIEFLHAQGIAHRDIKPDNLLLTADDVLKVVDFGVSEMFEKDPEMMTAKSAGSPAFLPPELCVVKHGDVSGRAADIWSMGISLYCLRFGHIPFEQTGILELYEAIKNDEVDCTPCDDSSFVDLIHRILEKDAKKRITMDELREHPWVTKDGTDPLLSKEENVSDLLEPPTQIELNHAITSNIGGLLIVMKAVNKFKSLLYKKHPERAGGLFGGHKQLFQPPAQMHELDFEAKHVPQRTKSKRQDHFSTITSTKSFPDEHDLPDAVTSEPGQATENSSTSNPLDSAAPHANNNDNDNKSRTSPPPTFTTTTTTTPSPLPSPSGRGQAHDPLDEAPLYLRVGSGHADHPDTDTDTIAQSPAAAEFNIYDKAYREEVARIRGVSESTLVYLNRRVSAWDSAKTGGRAAPGGSGGADPAADLDSAAVSNPATTTTTAAPDDGTAGAPDDAKSATPSSAAHPANQAAGETHEA
ncbi:CAMKK/META protein kinase [Pseudogymnoascus sp. 05NY08]|nr:CAMKK/META protein kinase [Pseudogymnoascus sp. 05NY08]